jgi:uncharacterized membrane protein
VSSRDSHHRSIAKAVSWRATGTLDTFILSYLITGNLVFAGSIAGVETMTKIGLYYAHERVWSRIAWGRRSGSEALAGPHTVAPALRALPTQPIRAGRTALDRHLAAVRSVRDRAQAAAQAISGLWMRRRHEMAGGAAVLAVLAVIVGSPFSSSRPAAKSVASKSFDGLPSSGQAVLSSAQAASTGRSDPSDAAVQPVGHDESNAPTLAYDPLPGQTLEAPEADLIAAADRRPVSAAQGASLADGAEPSPEPTGQPPRQGSPTRNLSDADQARSVQQRLAELGFFHTSATGVWGPNSRQALAAFKAQAQLSGDDVWDEVTERSLFGADVRSSTSFVGQWAPTAQACRPQLNQSGLLPATISEQGAWAGETTCTFQRRRQSGSAWTMVAACSDQRSRWTAKVRLEVRGDRLTWSSERGSQTYVRCRQGEIYAQMAN